MKSTGSAATAAPAFLIALNEVLLAICFIFGGFNASAVTTDSVVDR